MDYEILYENMQPKLVFPALDEKNQISQDLAHYILTEVTKHGFTLSEIRGLLARVADVAMLSAKPNYTYQKD